MKNLNKIKEVIEAFGWERIHSKNTAMVSFTKDGERLNYYFTTGTTTFQSDLGGMEVYREINTDVEMEKILCTRPNKA